MRPPEYDLALLGLLTVLNDLPPEEWGPHLAPLGVTTDDALSAMEDVGQVIRDYLHRHRNA